MRFGAKREIPAVGCTTNGGYQHHSPRVAISFPPWMALKLSEEAARHKTSFAEIVRRHVAESYRAKVTEE